VAGHRAGGGAEVLLTRISGPGSSGLAACNLAIWEVSLSRLCRTWAQPARRTEPAGPASQAVGTIGQSFAWPYRRRLPYQSGGNTGAGRDQKAGEGDQGPLDA
jgi:hypothetical protein